MVETVKAAPVPQHVSLTIDVKDWQAYRLGELAAQREFGDRRETKDRIALIKRVLEKPADLGRYVHVPASGPVVYTDEFRANLKAWVKNSDHTGAKKIDGAYMFVTSQPCVDNDVVVAARTHAQRKAAKKAVARGGYPGFVYP